MASNKEGANIQDAAENEFDAAANIFNDIALVWLDENSDERRDKLLELLNRHSQMAPDVQTVCCINDCLNHLKSNSQKSTFLLISGPVNEDVLQTMLSYRHITQIFVFNDYVISRGNHHKLVAVDVDKLIDQLHHAIKLHCNTPMLSGSLNMYYKSQHLRHLDIVSREFLFHQLLIEILMRLPIQSVNESGFLSYLLKSFAKNTACKDIIKKFGESYERGQVLSWYTRPTFIFRIINQICRRGSVDLMLKIRFFLYDLYSHLREFHDPLRDSFPRTFCVFRGMTMHIDDFNQLEASIGKLVITKSFLSATLDRKVACFYAGDGYTVRPYVSVIFQIEIDTTINESKPFAVVGRHGMVSDDNEVILSIGTIFRHNGTRKLTDNTWEVRWIRGAEEIQIEQEILNQYLRTQTGETNIFLQMARFLQMTENRSEVSQYCGLVSCALNPSDINTIERLRACIDLDDGEISRLIAEPASVVNFRTHIIIWLDAYIGNVHQYADLKHMFCTITSSELTSTDDHPDVMHAAYWMNFSDVVQPVFCVDTIDGCLKLLEQYASDKKVFFITSGSFGGYLLPIIVEKYPIIDSIYVFCHNIAIHCSWGMDFVEILQMFDHEMNLLCRLARDISRYYTKLGRDYNYVEESTRALSCFQFARTLRLRSDFMEPNSPTAAYSVECIQELNTLIQNVKAQLPCS